MLDRLKVLGGLVAVAFIGVALFSNDVTAILTGWVLCVYVLWRAFPAVRADLVRLWGRMFPETAWRD